MEQIREVEAFVGLNPVNTLLEPVDVQGTDGRRVVAGCCSGPGMGPDVNGPASTVVMPPMVDVLLCCLIEDKEELCFRIAQVNIVHLRAHGLTPLGQASQGDPAPQYWSHPPGLPVAALLSARLPSGLRLWAPGRSLSGVQARQSTS